MVKGLLIVDHGSRRAEANDVLGQLCELVRSALPSRESASLQKGGTDTVSFVTHAHMELAEPSIPQGVAACVAAGCEHIVVMPYFLFPGRHAFEDVPRLVAQACEPFEGLSFEVGQPLGVHAKLAELVLERAGL